MICTVPLPPGAASATFRVAPAPSVCSWCDGAGVEPDEEAAELKCGRCGGFGWESLAGFDFGPSRTCDLREVSYTPAGANCGLLKITTAKKLTHRTQTDVYQLAEDPQAEGARGFVCRKTGGDEPYRSIEMNEQFIWCDCQGGTYLTAAKANQRAHELNEKTYPTFGCKHADALAALVAGGWFDLIT